MTRDCIFSRKLNLFLSRPIYFDSVMMKRRKYGSLIYFAGFICVFSRDGLAAESKSFARQFISAKSLWSALANVSVILGNWNGRSFDL